VLFDTPNDAPEHKKYGAVCGFCTSSLLSNREWTMIANVMNPDTGRYRDVNSFSDLNPRTIAPPIDCKSRRFSGHKLWTSIHIWISDGTKGQWTDYLCEFHNHLYRYMGMPPFDMLTSHIHNEMAGYLGGFHNSIYGCRQKCAESYLMCRPLSDCPHTLSSTHQHLQSLLLLTLIMVRFAIFLVLSTLYIMSSAFPTD
jgi:hypothetical protein